MTTTPTARKFTEDELDDLEHVLFLAFDCTQKNRQALNHPSNETWLSEDEKSCKRVRDLLDALHEPSRNP